MIYYLTVRSHAFMMQTFLDGWGKSLAGRITIIPYEHLFSGEPVRLQPGTYIFTSLGRVLGSRQPPSQPRQLVIELHGRLVDAFGPARVLNDPGSSLGRVDLLQALNASGINRFAAHRVGASRVERFPVFLRPQDGTLWDAPPLLRTHEQYAAAVSGAAANGLLAVEFCDTADGTGVFRKYGCFIVGERIVPRHVFFSRNWLVKEADLQDPVLLEEELDFLGTNPHAPALREAARIANISYGRIDYSMLGNEPQIWEINMAALIASEIAAKIPARNPVHAKFVPLFAAALDAIDPPAG